LLRVHEKAADPLLIKLLMKVRVMPLVSVQYAVSIVAQTSDMSCWAAAAAALLSWKSGDTVTELQVVQQAGAPFEAALDAGTGLFGPDVAAFANSLNLSAEAPQNWDVDGYAALLTAHGPLWVGSALMDGSRTYRHVRLLTGLEGDGSPDGTMASVVDPDGGKSYQETVTDFATELENIARLDLSEGSDLNPQVIHFP
jgi:hypothetical protein